MKEDDKDGANTLRQWKNNEYNKFCSFVLTIKRLKNLFKN